MLACSLSNRGKRLSTSLVSRGEMDAAGPGSELPLAEN
jgi:hypothetical protein